MDADKATMDGAPRLRVRTARADIAVSALLMAVALAVILMARQFPPALNPADVGPGRFPMLAGLGTLVCASIMLARGLARRLDRLHGVEVVQPWAVGLVAVVLVGYAALIPIAGFYASSALFVPVVMIIVGERRWWALALAAVGFNLFVYVCFDLALKVQFP